MRRTIPLILWLLTLALPLSALASGTYSARPIRPPVSAVDANKYNIGKRIFAGKREPGRPADDAATQSPRLNELQTQLQSARLNELQAQLPKSARKRANLPALAGKLNNEQMQSLEYYLNVRYKIK